MSISVRQNFYYKVALIIVSALAAGTAYRPSWMPPAVATDTIGVSSTLLFIMTSIYALLTPDVSSTPTSTGKSATAVCLALVGLSVAFALFQPADAKAETLSQVVAGIKTQVAALNGKVTTLNGKIGTAAGLQGKPATDLNTLLNQVSAANLIDMNAALEDAKANDDGLAVSCYPPVIAMVQTFQTSMSKPDLPKVHPILLFQHGRDLANAIRPGSKINIACSPMAGQVKMDFTTFIGAIIGGTLTAASFGL